MASAQPEPSPTSAPTERAAGHVAPVSSHRSEAHEVAGRLSPSTRRDFALVVPAFNEAPMAEALVAELRRAWSEYELEGEILVVDDGSTDGTADLVEREAAGWNRLRVLRHRANEGKTSAIVTAAGRTERKWLIVFDADLQHMPDEIPRFLAKLQDGWDIVTGRKIGPYDKAVVSSVYNRVSRRVFKVPVSDLNSMKAFRRSILEEIHLRHDWHRFFVVLAHARGWSVTEIDITLHPRRAGVSKYRGPLRILSGLLDLTSVGFLLMFSHKPLLLFGGAGAVLIAAGVLVGVAAFWLRFVEELGFRPLLYLVILLETVGFLLLGIGLLAELIAQLRSELEAMKNRFPGPPGGS